MLKNAEAETLMQDARTIHAEAARLIDAGDWRNASEKGWLAATAALAWNLTGVHNQTETDISLALSSLAHQRGGQYDELSILYGHLTHILLYVTFYDGFYYDDIPDLIREVADYIRRAEELAEKDG